MSADPEVIAAVEGKCPYCGAGLKSRLHYPLYECGTWFSPKHQDWNCKDPCFERQLARQAELLRRAGEALKAWKEYAKFTTNEVIKTGQINMIPGGADSLRFRAFINLQKAWPKALLPDLEKALEVGK